jgi:chaperonin cofactor prefoldin
MSRYVMGRAYGYGNGDEKPIRTLGEDLVRDREKTADEKLNKMEDRIKKHITECKREVLKELNNLFNGKEKKNGSKSKRNKSDEIC